MQSSVALPQNGFTLIELLVVISITSLISSTVLSSLSSARGEARDAKRRQDMNQIRVGLERYYNDNGNYPPASGDPSECYKEYIGDGTGNFDAEMGSYLNSIPKDPKQGEPGFGYIYDSKFSTPEGSAVLYGFKKSESGGSYQTVSSLGFSKLLYPAPNQLSCSGPPAMSPFTKAVIF